MPHATSPTIVFQVLILCGPGESLNPFNANPSELPKALIPIANRPMVWYPLEWCYRSGITNVTIIAPQVAVSALEGALLQNPYLTELPKPDILAPPDLTLTTGTAEILRLPQVQDKITGDFIILPCDLVCEMSGTSLFETWTKLLSVIAQPGDKEDGQGHRGALGVWYQTKDAVTEGGVGVNKEETDFLATEELYKPIVPPPLDSLIPQVEKVVMTLPTSVLKDKIAENGGFKIRNSALRHHGSLKMRTTLRDAHVYIFPYWVKEYVRINVSFESIGEDVLGWWAKAGWQHGLAQKLSMDKCIGRSIGKRSSSAEDVELRIDLATLVTTSIGSTSNSRNLGSLQANERRFASRVTNGNMIENDSTLEIPPLFAYTHLAQPAASLLRRVDTVPLLLSVSLYLAKLPALSDDSLTKSTLSQECKIHPSSIPSPELRLTLERATVLVDSNVTFTSKSIIRESVIGSGCVLGTSADLVSQEGMSVADIIKSAPAGVRIQKCLLMDEVIVEAGCTLSACVLGRKCKIGKDSDLKDCFVQEGYVVPAGTIAKGEVLAGFDEGKGMEDGLDISDGEDDIGDAMQGEIEDDDGFEDDQEIS